MTNDSLRVQPWKAFQAAGMLWLINRTLHLFGWAVFVQVDADGTVSAYPARTTYRGFAPESEARGFKSVTDYMAANAADLQREVDEE